MNIFSIFSQSDIYTAASLILVPNLVAAIAATLFLRKAKTSGQFSKRVLTTIGVYIVVANIIAVLLLSSLNPDHGFYWLDENEGGTWLFTLLPASVLFSLLFASIYEWKFRV